MENAGLNNDPCSVRTGFHTMESERMIDTRSNSMPFARITVSKPSTEKGERRSRQLYSIASRTSDSVRACFTMNTSLLSQSGCCVSYILEKNSAVSEFIDGQRCLSAVYMSHNNKSEPLLSMRFIVYSTATSLFTAFLRSALYSCIDSMTRLYSVSVHVCTMYLYLE